MTESFDHKITHTICDAKLLKLSLNPPANLLQMTEYLFKRTIGDCTSRNNLSAAIHQIFDFFLRTGRQLDKSLRKEYTRALCAATVDYRGRDTILFFKPGVEIDTHSHSWGGISNHVVATAAYLGDNLYFKRLSREEAIECGRNIYFSFPLACAAKQDHYDIM